MNARIIAYNLFSVFLCPVMLPWQPTGTNYREEGPHLGFYIYIYTYKYSTNRRSTVSYANIMAEINFDSISISDEEMEISETVQTSSKYLINVSTLINKHTCTWWKNSGHPILAKETSFCNFCCARESLPIKITWSIRTFYLLYTYTNLRMHRNKRMIANSIYVD